jgi:hypothetical protein
VDDTLDELKDVNFYTHLDLASGFWQVRVRDEDVHKTAFQTPDGMMEWIAMPFGLCNASATFQRMMNGNLRDFYTSPLLSTSTTFVFTTARWTNTLSTYVWFFSDLRRRA